MNETLAHLDVQPQKHQSDFDRSTYTYESKDLAQTPPEEQFAYNLTHERELAYALEYFERVVEAKTFNNGYTYEYSLLVPARSNIEDRKTQFKEKLDIARNLFRTRIHGLSNLPSVLQQSPLIQQTSKLLAIYGDLVGAETPPNLEEEQLLESHDHPQTLLIPITLDSGYLSYSLDHKN